MNPEKPDTTFPIIVERWRPREEIRKEYLDSLDPEELRRDEFDRTTGSNTDCPPGSASVRGSASSHTSTIPISRACRLEIRTEGSGLRKTLAATTVSPPSFTQIWKATTARFLQHQG